MDFPTDHTLIYETVHGSTAYGLARAGSDVDLKGVFVGPAAWYHGFLTRPEQIELDKDHVRFEIRKFMRLAAEANPTIIEVLWTDPKHHRAVAPAGEKLLAARHQFMSKRVRGSFGSYAVAQLKRIKTHRRWLLSPPKEEPTRGKYGLPEHTVISKEQLGAAQALIDRGSIDEAELTPNFLAIMGRERAYRQARAEWTQYHGWKKNRNPARAALEAQFGYDCKHAQHLVRLLRMCVEILQTGEVTVERPDREELLAIRDGAWSYDELLERAEALEADVAAAAEASTLPDRADRDVLDVLCAEIVEEVIR